MEDEKTPTTSEAEDVEGHLLRDRPGTERPGTERTPPERPPAEASSEGPDFELHGT